MALTRPRFSQFDTTISSISDPITVLNKLSTNANIDVGFIINRNAGVSSNVALFWQESSNTFALAYTSNSGELTGSLTNSNIIVSQYADLRVNSLSGNISGSSITITGNITAGNVITSNIFYPNGAPFQTGGGTVSLISSNTAPPDPTVGALWYDTGSDILFQYTNDGASNVWIDITSDPVSTIAGSTNKSIYTGKATVSNVATLIDTVPASGNSAVTWTLTSTDNTNSRFKSSMVNSINDGANVYYTEYAIILSNSSFPVATFTSNITLGNVNLYAVGDSSNVTVAFQRGILGSSTINGYVLSGATGANGATGPAANLTNITSNINVNNGYQITVGVELPGANIAFPERQIVTVANANVAAGINVRNLSSGGGASSNFIAVSDTNENDTHFTVFGIASSGYNSSGSLIAPGDAYVSVTGGNLVLVPGGTQDTLIATASGNILARFRTTTANVSILANAVSTSTTTGALTVAGGLGVAGALNVGGAVTIDGNLIVNGNTTTINANNLTVNDSIIYLAEENPADTLDIGITAHVVNPSLNHVGFVRDATDSIWKLFSNVATQPTTTVDFTGARYANLQVGNLIASSIVISGTIDSSSSGACTIGGLTLSSGSIFRNGAEMIIYGGGQSTTRSLIRLGNSQGLVLYGRGTANAPSVPNNGIIIHGGDGNVQIRAPNTASGGSRIQLQAELVEIQGNLTPVGNLLYSIGNVTNQWNTVYAANIAAGNVFASGFANINITSGSADSALQIVGNVARGGAGYHDFLRVTSTAGGATNISKHFRLTSTGSLEIVNSAYSSTILSLTDGGNIIASGTIQDSKGDVRSSPINSQPGSYTAVATDAGKTIVESLSAAAITFNASVFAAGDMVSVVNTSAGSITLVQGTNVTLRLAGTATTGTRTLASNGLATVICTVGGANPTFYCSGAGLT